MVKILVIFEFFMFEVQNTKNYIIILLESKNPEKISRNIALNVNKFYTKNKVVFLPGIN